MRFARSCRFIPLWILWTGLAPASALAIGDGKCASWSTVEQIATIGAPGLVELSGLQASRRSPDHVWVHNDAGNEAELYALNWTGGLEGTVRVSGVEHDDWEDLAVGPCMEGYQASCSCLYLADTGSGSGDREEAVIYRIEEPDPSSSETVVPQTLWFRYPDRGHDAETILVHPLTGETLVLTKNPEGPTQVFAFPDIPPYPAAEDDPVELIQVALIDMAALDPGDGALTGGSVSPLGERLVLRTASGVFALDIPGDSLQAAFEEEPQFLFEAPTPAGEAIGFDLAGDRIWMVDEGTNSPLWSVACADFEPTSSPEEDPLLICEGGRAEPECGCSGGEAAWLWLLPGLGWRRRRNGNLPR